MARRIGDNNQNRVLDPDNVSDTLKCPVCMDVFNDPVFCGGRPCQHVFCRECVEHALERLECCPVCREDMQSEDLYPHQVIRSLLDEVCVFCERQCGWTGRRDSHVAHLAVCPVVLMEEANEKFESQSRRFMDADTQLLERDARIAELEDELSRKENQVIKSGREVVKGQLRNAELEECWRTAKLQVANYRHALEEKSAELESLKEALTLRENVGYAGVMADPAARVDQSAPPPTPLNEGLQVRNTLEDVFVLDPSAVEAAVEKKREDAWLDPPEFSQMTLAREEVPPPLAREEASLYLGQAVSPVEEIKFDEGPEDIDM